MPPFFKAAAVAYVVVVLVGVAVVIWVAVHFISKFW